MQNNLQSLFLRHSELRNRSDPKQKKQDDDAPELGLGLHVKVKLLSLEVRSKLSFYTDSLMSVCIVMDTVHSFSRQRKKLSCPSDIPDERTH